MRFAGAVEETLAHFLSARTMKVSVSGCLSSSRNVLSGVPQGSVLGPLLFIVYVNCLPSFILNNCKLFADDLKLYLRVPTDSNSESYRGLQACQNDIDAVVRISELWGLALNTKKCVLLRFGGSPAGLGVLGELHTYLIHNTVLSESDSARDLGVIVDRSLKFHMHARSEVSSASGLANSLLRSTLCRSKEFMVTLLKTYIWPVKDYCSTVWNTGYVCDVEALEAVQQRWTKQVEGIGDMVYGDRLSFLDLYSIRGRLLRADLIKCWKVFHGECSVSPTDIFVFPPVLNLTRGHRFKLGKVRCRLECRRRFFFFRCELSTAGTPCLIMLLVLLRSTNSNQLCTIILGHRCLNSDTFILVRNVLCSRCL